MVDGNGDVMEILEIVARQVRVLGVISDSPATLTRYATRAGLK